MEFVWHDGGRAACGFVGQAGDCVTRSVAIVTGDKYRDVYDRMAQLGGSTPRSGVRVSVMRQYLAERNWNVTDWDGRWASQLPEGALLLNFEPLGRSRTGHISCVIDRVLYDTWQPFEDPTLRLAEVLICSNEQAHVYRPGVGGNDDTAGGNEESRLTQQEYERILKRVRALHRTASNEASTEGEIRNAMRAMQALMLQHNLSRSDIVDDGEIVRMGMTRRACPLNGKRACQWEASLAFYLTTDIFPSVQHYRQTVGHRSLYWFYGPVDDVQQSLELYREMLMTIATAARLRYGTHVRGSGASYAEGYVHGLPRNHAEQEAASATGDVVMSQNALIQSRMLAVHDAANNWLFQECGIRLRSGGTRYGRGDFDRAAHSKGKADGAKHDYAGKVGQKRIGHQ
ncbi:MAG: DUF2786 domain-containing protein [Pirellulaceae bacterium]|nr:DUF2786 domain-containing protein [Planctomycetales bacterium]